MGCRIRQFALGIALMIMLVSGCGKNEPPIVVSAAGYSPQRMQISWRYTTGNRYSRYFLYRDTEQIAYFPPSTLAYADTGLTPGATHCYEMYAPFLTGTIVDIFLLPFAPLADDLYSNEACATLPSLAPWAETAGLPVNPDLAIDVNGKTHLAWPTATGFGYRSNRSGSWIEESITLTNAPDGELALAVDINGAAHVAWVRQAVPSMIGYATNASGSWVTDTIHVDGTYQQAIDIGVDPDTVAHVLYYESTAKETHASGSVGSWSYAGFASGGNLPGFMGIFQLKVAVAPDGTVHFVRRDPNSLNHATNTDHAWSSRIGVTWNIRMDLAVAPDGTPWVAQWDQSVPPRLTLTTPDVPYWPTTWLHDAPVGVTTGDVSLTIDSSGVKHLLYMDDGYLVYSNTKGKFSRQFIDGRNISNPHIAMASGKVHTAYTELGTPQGIYAIQP